MKRITRLLVGMAALALSASGFAAGEKGAAAPDLSKSYKVSDLTSMNVKNPNGDDLGTISELIVDKDGKVSHVVLNEGGVAGVGGNDYIVPWDRVQLSAGEDAVIIDANKDALAAEFAAFEENAPTAGDRTRDRDQTRDQTKDPDQTKDQTRDQDRMGTGKPSSTNP